VCLIDRQPRGVAAVVLGSLPVIEEHIGAISLLQSPSHIELTLKCIGTHSLARPTSIAGCACVRVKQRPSGFGLD
jgi:hypothetical protein